MKILFIQTGGTIDKDYPKLIKGQGFEITSPAFSRILKKINPAFEYEIVILFKKDSLEITDSDRKKIKEVCVNSDAAKIIITHGTDTMIETAQYLSVISDKAIVLTGSFLPEKFSDSDAEFNLGTAVGALNILKTGVFIAMNGRIFPHNKVKRDSSTGRFFSL